MGESYPHLYGISIHAPAKGATTFKVDTSVPVVFQSTLPRRERPGLGRRRLWLGNFNPRSREGSDILADALGILTVTISIHAPAKGATLSAVLNGRRNFYFNPRSREGSDFSSLRQRFLSLPFQSTLPRRERQLINTGQKQLDLFQSTLPRRERRRPDCQ